MLTKQLIINGRPTEIRIEIAKTFLQRLLGLIPRKEMPENTGLLLLNCSNIHTFFMNFAIDAVYLTASNQVIRIDKNIQPYRIFIPQEKGKSVIEFSSGVADKIGIKLNDEIELV